MPDQFMMADADRTILIVDDTPANLGVMADYLEEHGFKAVVAQDGEEALQRARWIKPALILLDVMMPGMDGFETCRRLKGMEETSTIPVIFMSALTDTGDKLCGFDAGGVDYIAKPFQVAEVLARVSTHLALRRMQAEVEAQNTRLQEEVEGHRQAELALKRAFGKLEESDRRMQAIINGGQAFTVLLEPNGVVTEINAAALAFRNAARAEVVGRIFWDSGWFDGMPEAAVETRALIARASRGTKATGNIAMPGHGGTAMRFSCVASAIPGAPGSLQGVIFEAYDMTEFYRIQERNQALELEIIQSQKMEALGTLAAGIAHEINTPMQYIGDNLRFTLTAFQELLSATGIASAPAGDLAYLISEIPQALAEAMEGTQRVRQIVDAVKLFSHPDTDEKIPQDLGQAILATVGLSRNQWKFNATIETDIGDLPPVPCHLGEINQVLLNLIVNAAQSIEDRVAQTHDKAAEGVIRIGLARAGDRARIDITDNGCGIPPENLSRIYDLFFTTKAPGRGTGQGLAICQNIMRKHGGRLSCTSAAGRGTTFTIELPLAGDGA